MPTIICTSGISIAQGVEIFATLNNAREYQKHIERRISEIQNKSGDDQQMFLQKVSAETNSLLRLKVDREDRIYLLHSETTDGEICAELVKSLLEKNLNCKNVKLQKINGLQVQDAVRFRRHGIQNLFEQLRKIVDAAPSHERSEVILNVTGGYKSTIPYITLYGLLSRIKVVYLFEHSNTLIELPPAPVNFDYGRLAPAHDALLTLCKKGGMPKEEFFKRIPGLEFHEREWYEALLEEDGGLVTLSAFGFLLSAGRDQEQAHVWLSPSAREQYERSQGPTRDQFRASNKMVYANE
jgi:putative CRISPR-associated protein (TIGR02619 family)